MDEICYGGLQWLKRIGVDIEATVSVPADSHQMDYEAELIIVMGRHCARTSESDALSYIYGYCNGNDLSARDLQFRTSQWLLGKSADFWRHGPVYGDC